MTIIAQDIKWLEKIAENQQFRSTWTAKIKGEKYIVKKLMQTRIS